MKKSLKLAAILFFFLLGMHAIAQRQDTPGPVKQDSISFVKRIQRVGSEEAIRSIETYKKGQIAARQSYLLEAIRNTTRRARLYLKKGIDTTSIVAEIKQTNNYLAIVKDGVFTNKGVIQTQRNLAVSSAILAELLFRINERREVISTYTTTLAGFRDHIDSLSSDTALYTFSSDSVKAMNYLKRMKVIAKEIGPADTALDRSLLEAQSIQNDADLLAFSIASAREDVENYRKELTHKTSGKELPYLFSVAQNDRPLRQIVRFSIAKERLALFFYMEDNIGKLLLVLLLSGVLSIFLISVKRNIALAEVPASPEAEKLALRYPVLTAVLLVCCLFQFVFFEPPFIFIFCFWLLAAVCLTIIFRKFITGFWMRFWLLALQFFVLAGTDNFLLQASQAERWFMLMLTLGGTLFGAYFLYFGRKSELKVKAILYFISFMTVMEAAAVVTNIAGRYNLSKTMMVSGYAGLVIAILFLWTARLINEVLGITSSMFKHAERSFFFIDFQRLGDRVPASFYFLLVLGWFILVGRNFYEFKEIATPINDFLTTDRTVGDYTFTINGLFVFLIILVTSMLLSRVISFFASDPDNAQTGLRKNKVGLGSWLLLVRILVVSLGFFLALAAAGIPLDKLTIVLGALSVGVGLGLQGLVNNLVSGLIIAFEKPVNVGDFIQLNGNYGVIKSIGFRSSVVNMFDGASVVIPNGDLLSQRLMYWTTSKNKLRLSLNIHVAFGSDIEKVRNVITRLLDENEMVLKYPLPSVQPVKFDHYSIELGVTFWIRHFLDSGSVKGAVITSIINGFKENGIIIPFPPKEAFLHPDAEESTTSG